ncbi:MAG: TaqI-like C-terminal specificity domain-containing protein [Candidatus Krumholzibacteria bacterium]|nr:TaqI-like C-terminal specificity domain-containing protein [Candidatus Krumholzibacteria bacterium]
MANREKLHAKERGKWKHDKWYAFGRSQNLSEMEQRKILTPSIAQEASYTLDNEGIYYFLGSGGGGGGGYGITLKTDLKESYEYILGLLNSRLLDWMLKRISSTFRGGYFAFSRQFIESLPIRTIDFSNPAEKEMHDRIAALVRAMLTLKQRQSATSSEQENIVLQSQIDTTDAEINNCVYTLYGLTKGEISIIDEVIEV